MKYDEAYIQSKDIDWFCVIGDVYCHIASAGGVLPDQINDREKYEDLLRKRDVDMFRWDAQICESKSIGDLDEQLIRRVVRSGIVNGRIHASAAEDSVEQLLERFELIQRQYFLHA